ncbi:MFS transporter [Sphingomonas sinipercae]|uniref:MFS transporter n=1 Tax=Sphingomonas sinipercae TaxID=2714944 RepID=A0A6G7ZKR0_9SPHN|nr:MFS transporter [Sphingomonas sinipercae]QIL01500.1 MFS transporter [Sphingomonas sinipercae]
MSDEATNPARTRVLLLLLLAYIFNFLDRQIVSILKIPIKAELGLTDTQLGLMGGIAFASVYSTLAIPIARYADRTGRRARVIGISAAIWSLFTALSGFVTNFGQLFAARMGVGVGEAGGVAPSYALIAEHVPANRRARAFAIFSLGIPIGSALGLFFGGWIAEAVNWRTAFVVIGLAGLPVGWLIATRVPESASGEPRVDQAQPGFGAIAAQLARLPSFWLLSFGAASASVAGYGLAFWLPSYFSESLGLSLGSIGTFFGTIVLIGGIAGIYLGGLVADRLGGARIAAYAATPAFAFLLTAPMFGAAMAVESRIVAGLLFTFAYALSLVWLGPIANGVQMLVEPARRATASACFLLINNLIGIGFGTFIFGFIADALRPTYGADAMRYSINYGLGFYAVAAALCGIAAFTIKRDAYQASA